MEGYHRYSYRTGLDGGDFFPVRYKTESKLFFILLQYNVLLLSLKK